MQRQLGVQRADFFPVAVSRDGHGAVYIAKRGCFQQFQCGNALACGQFKSVNDERIIAVFVNLDGIAVRLAVVDKDSFFM